MNSGKKFTGVFQANLANGCVDIVYSHHFTDDQITQLKAIREQIIKGEIKVYDAVNP